MPTITVEDGSGVSGANSYVDVAYVDSFADDRGLDLPDTTLVKEQYIIKAMDYLGFFTDRLDGYKTATTNDLPFPRKEFYVNGEEIEDDEIPEELKQGLAQLVVEQHAGTALWPTAKTNTGEGYVTEKTLGPMTKKFSDKGQGSASSYGPTHIMSVAAFLNQVFPPRYTRTLRA